MENTTRKKFKCRRKANEIGTLNPFFNTSSKMRILMLGIMCSVFNILITALES